MDGVLIDSGDTHFRAWREILAAERRAPLSTEDFRRTFGQRNSEMLRIILGADLPDDAAARLADLKEAHYRDLLRRDGIQPLPGVLQWLQHFSQVGWQHAVASSAPRANLEAILDVIHMRHYFGALVTAEDVSRGKPDPEVFLTAAQKLGVSPARCVVIEDAPTGVEGARRAGMACIGVLTTHERLDADVTAPTLLDVPLDAPFQLVDARAG